MSDKPKLSVIIPAYKFAKYIQQSVYSALWQQTDFPFEVLVRDDFSEDGTAEFLARINVYHKNLRYFPATENWGYHKNIEFLYNQCQGEYVSYLDGDDYFTDEKKLQRQVDFLDKNPEYVGHCTSYWRFDERNMKMVPTNPLDFLTSKKLVIELDDLIEHNYITFGRTFRKIPNLFKPWMKEVTYLDYAVNVELCKHGKFICQEFPPGGVYRESGEGLLTKLNDDEKRNLHHKSRDIILKNLQREQMKTLTIIDCYLHNEFIENKLSLFLDSANQNNIDVLLISNTVIPDYIQQKVKYCIHIKENILFSENFDNIPDIILWKHMQGFRINEHVSGMQRHGLSVMVNIFKSLDFAKTLGYDYFQRIEVDALLGPQSWEFIKDVPILLQEKNKHGLFYYNHYTNSSDFSFHFFVCKIDLFLESVKRVNNEKDYKDFIFEVYGDNRFMNVEEYLYHNFERNNFKDLYMLHSAEQKINLPDTQWNTETSMSNVESKYEGVTSNFYKIKRKNEDGVHVETGDYILLTFSYLNKESSRYVKLYSGYDVVQEFVHTVYGKGSWTYHPVSSGVTHIEVFEGDRLLFMKEKNNISSNVEFD